ncbi:MAG: response regulator [Planctomycetales bacterium]|nr:response regulator [Planctomycetales bacterium]
MKSNFDNSRCVEILLVEDSPSDALLTLEALRESRVSQSLHRVEVHHVKDGIDALAYLRREGCYVDATMPDVVLLDLNMPRKNGHEVLQEIREDEVLHHLPVIVLTTSCDENDVLMAYGRHANCYITKPVDMTDFVTAMRSLGDFWFGWVTLPPVGE